MQAIPINRVEATLTEWSTALTDAFIKAGHAVTYHPFNNGTHRLGTMHVTKPGDENHNCYKIEFERKLEVVDGERVVFCGVEVYNPNGGLHVHLKGFSAKKVAKVVEYAALYLQKRIENDANVEAKRVRTGAARKVWEDSKVELPDWMSALANVDKDEDVGTFRLLFYDHRVNYGLMKLTPQQIGKIARYIVEIASEPSVRQQEIDLAYKLAQHEGKDLKYDRKADDKQWMDLTNNP